MHKNNNSTIYVFSKATTGAFYTDSRKDKKGWLLKCKICTKRIYSKVRVTSNFHRHAKVS